MKTLRIEANQFDTIVAALEYYESAGMGQAHADRIRGIRDSLQAATSDYKLNAPTYYGSTPEHEAGKLPEWGSPKVPLVAYEAEGLRVVLGTHDLDDMSRPDIQIERRAQGWTIFLHPIGGGDSAGFAYILDDGRCFVQPERLSGFEVLDAGDDVPDLDKVSV